MKQLHARYWNYDGNHPNGHDCERYDPHKLGLKLIACMAYIAEHQYDCNEVSLRDVIVKHHKGDDFGHQVHVAATREQWDAVREYLTVVDDQRLS